MDTATRGSSRPGEKKKGRALARPLGTFLTPEVSRESLVRRVLLGWFGGLGSCWLGRGASSSSRLGGWTLASSSGWRHVRLCVVGVHYRLGHVDLLAVIPQ